MRPHIRLTLARALPERSLAFWGDAIADRSLIRERLTPGIDRVLGHFGVPFLATEEYPHPVAGWSADEIAAGLNRVYRLVLHRSRRIPPGLIDALRLVPGVVSAAPGGIASVPLEPAYSLARVTGEASRAAILLDEAHRFSRGHASVTIAVLDTGVAGNHPELRAAMLPGYDFVDIIDGADAFIGDLLDADPDPDDDVGHGTHVAGILAARGSRMPPGVVPRCRILPVRVLAAMKRDGRVVGAGLVDNINTGVKWAVDQGADVINMSLGVRHTGGGLPHQEVVDYARRRGVTVVAASGNDGREALYYPSALPGVIAVGAAGPDGTVAEYSTYGEQVGLIAPGTDIFSTFLDDDYAFSTGTSHAAPFVTGVVALLKSMGRERGRRVGDGAVKHVLKHTSDKQDRHFRNRRAGYGHLNARDAARLLDHRLDQAGSPL